jgi:hypothetical protein
MSKESVELVRRVYEAFAERDLDTLERIGAESLTAVRVRVRAHRARLDGPAMAEGPWLRYLGDVRVRADG